MSTPIIAPKVPKAGSNIFSFLPSAKSFAAAAAVFWQLPTGIAVSALGHKIEPRISTDHKRTYQIAFRASQIAFIALTGFSGAAGILLGEVLIGDPFKARAPDTADRLNRMSIVATLILDALGKQTIFIALGLISPLPFAARIAVGGLVARANWIRQDDADIAWHMLGLALVTFAGGLPALGGYVITYLMIGPELSTIEWKAEPTPETLPNFTYRRSTAEADHEPVEGGSGDIAAWLNVIQAHNQPEGICVHSTAEVKSAVFQAFNHFISSMNENLPGGKRFERLSSDAKYTKYKFVFRKMSKIMHPDVYKGDNPEAAKEFFQDLSAAHDSAEKLNYKGQL